MKMPRPLLLLLFLVAAPLLHAQVVPGRASLIVRLRPGLDAKSERQLQGTVQRAARGTVSLAPIVSAGPGRQLAHARAGLDRYRVLLCDSVSLPGVRAALAATSEVELAFANHRYTLDAAPNDSLYSEQWALQRVEAERAWEITLGDSSVLVGVLDTGIDFFHPDLTAALAINRGEDANGNGIFDDADLNGIDDDHNGLVDDVIGYDFVDQAYANLGDWTGRDPVPGDDQGHGTSVAGVVAATRNNRIGVAGLAPGCRILVLRAFDATGNAEDDDLAAAIVYAANRGVRVLNMSFGDYYASPLLGDAIRYAQERGVLIVASAGNEGVDLPHFPADFPGVMGVSASSKTDNIASFSNFGHTTSISAPGSSVLTTKVGGGYHAQSGTSFSSPYAAAAAALVISLHPTWSADEVRTVLELSAEDRGRKGWDLYHGSGRLNAYRALLYPARPLLSITRPEYDVALTLAGRVGVVGSASAPLPFVWRLEYARDEENPVWETITPESARGIVDDTLGVLDAGALAPGAYVLRLALVAENGGTSERRVPFTVGGASPRIDSLAIDTVWRFDRRSIAVTASTSVETRLTLYVRERGTAQPWRPLALEPERSGWTRRHVLFLSESDLLADVVYESYAVVESTSGDTAMVGSATAPLLFARPAEAFSAGGATVQPYTLPYGYTMREGATLSGGERVTALNRYSESGEYGDLMVYAWRGGAFVPVDSTPEQWTPRDFGDADGDGRLELLGQAFDGGVVYGQLASGGSPLGTVRFADTTSGTFIPAEFADLDNDGRDEILARTMNGVGAPSEWRVWKLDGSTLRTTARIPNRTQPPSDGTNSYGSPVAAVGDFDGDQRSDILIADEDADAQIERGNGDATFTPAWSAEHTGDGGSEFVAAADINGDGRDEAVLAWHSRTYASPGVPYQPPFWTVVVYTFDSAMNARVLWSDRFAYVRPTVPFRSYVAARDLDGSPGAELALLFFPNFYILRWDSANARMVPVFWRGNAIGNAPAIADYNGDGRNEIGVADGARVRFIQLDARAPLLPPGAVEAWSTGDSSAHAEWSPVPGATGYTLYRGILPEGSSGGSITLSPIATVTGTSFEDTGVGTAERRLLSGRTYAYAVKTVAGSEESSLSGAGLATIHPRIAPVSAQAVDERSFVVRFSGEIGSAFRRPGAVDLRGRAGAPRELSTVVDAGDSALLVTLVHPVVAADTLTVRATLLLRDLFNSPVDTATALDIVLFPASQPGEVFIATRAELLGPTEVAVVFNDPVDPATLSAAAFAFAPRGRVLSLSVDPADPRRVLLLLDPAEPIAVNGRYVTITVTGVRDVSGREIGDGAGSTVALVLIGDETFVQVRALPQPFSRVRDERLTFAGLPRGAHLAIHTITGLPIRQLDESDGTGAIEWDGRDADGRAVPSGVYIYEVQSADRGASSGPRKFVVLP